MKSLGKKTCMVPLPVLVIGSYDEFKKPNAMVAAWGGIHDTDEISLCLSSEHKSAKNILLNKEFSVSFASKNLIKETDYFGNISGNDIDKLAKTNLNVEKSSINAPIFTDYPLTILCKVITITLDDNNTTFIRAKIIDLLANEAYLNGDHFDFDKAGFVCYNSLDNTYHEIGKSIGDAFSIFKEIK